MSLESKTVGFALTGSFCTIPDVLPQIAALRSVGAVVIPIVSQNVATIDTRFGKAADLWMKLEELTGRNVVSTIAEAEPIGPKALLDVLIVAPCTGNTLAKIANGITDTSVTMAVKAHLRNNRPVVLAVATNDGLGANAANIGKLMNIKDIYFVPFNQDNPFDKNKSLIAHFEQISETLTAALGGVQLQPVLAGP